MRKSSAGLLLSILAWMACGCGDGGGQASLGSTAVTLFLRGTPAEGLFRFEVRLESLRLLRADGEETPNLLPAPVTEMIGLADGFELLRSDRLIRRTYVGARIRIDPSSVVATRLDGSTPGVTVLSSEATALFPEPATLAAPRVNLVFHLVVASSLREDPAAPGSLLFDPVLAARCLSGTLVELEVQGVITDATPGLNPLPDLNELLMDILPDDRNGEAPPPVAEARLSYDATTLMIGRDQTVFSSPDAFHALLVEGRRLEVQAAQRATSSTLRANRIQIEGPPRAIQLRGEIESVDPVGQTFVLRVRTIERGFSDAAPVLASLPDSVRALVGWDGATFFHFSTAAGGPAGPADLVPGAGVTVAFSSLDGPEPFPSTEILIREGGPTFSGEVVDVDAVPDAFGVLLDADCPSVVAGLVPDRTATVRLDAGTTLVLDVADQPSLPATSLQIGQKVSLRGRLVLIEGRDPEIEATSVSVRPCVLEGTVTAVSTALSTLTIDVTNVLESCGLVEEDAITVTILPETVIEDTGASRILTLVELEELFIGLSADQVMAVRFRGIGEALGSATAYEVALRVRAAASPGG